LILAQKLGIPKIQTTSHMKLKKKEEQSVGASVLLRRGTKYSHEQIWRQSVEQRQKETPSRDCHT
jgi:deferrochelatase/peroxidase EfeB